LTRAAEWAQRLTFRSHAYRRFPAFLVAPFPPLHPFHSTVAVDDATLIALDLSGRRISSEGLGCLAVMTCCASTSARFVVPLQAWSPLTRMGTNLCLQDVLRLVNKSLRTLNLSKNSICCKGAQKLASALEVNGHVKSLKLAHNDIGDDGAACLARMLERNTSLTELNLSYNPIGNKGALELIGSLRSDSALTSIDVSFNTIDDKGILAAGLLLKARPFPPQFRLLGIKLATCWQGTRTGTRARVHAGPQMGAVIFNAVAPVPVAFLPPPPSSAPVPLPHAPDTGLDLPSEARDWENEAILSLFRKLQNSVCPQEIVIDACVSSR
jgi:hypothetical protein